MTAIDLLNNNIKDNLLVKITTDGQLSESAVLNTEISEGIVSVYYLDEEKDVAFFHEVDEKFNIVDKTILPEIKFQHGPIPKNGINGVTNENLLFILRSRITALNSKYPCAENEKAIMHCDAALEALRLRTANRRNRGVEGKLVV